MPEASGKAGDRDHECSSCTFTSESICRGVKQGDTPTISTVEPSNLLGWLKAPTKVDCARKRKVEGPQCSGRTKKHKAGAANLTDPKKLE